VIDAETAGLPHWQGALGEELGRAGPYRLLQLERSWLDQRARSLMERGHRASWQETRMERL